MLLSQIAHTFPASLAGVSTRQPYPDSAGFWTLAHCWHLQNSLNETVWIISGAFFPESKTKVDPNETAFLAIKKAFEDKDNQIDFILHNKLNQSMPVFDLRVSSWHLVPKFHSFAFPGAAQNGADIICAPQWHTAKTLGSKTLWWASQMAETLQSKPTCCLLQPQDVLNQPMQE